MILLYCLTYDMKNTRIYKDRAMKTTIVFVLSTMMTASGDIRPEYHVLILDGIPRTPAQVEHLNPLIDVLRIIHLKMNDQAKLVQRLKGRATKSNRPVDAQERVILNRVKVYEEETAPVLNCYDRNLLVNIEADQVPLAVLGDICRALAPVVPANI